MFKVECPGCNAPYQVDERRVPESGLQMRCPKCGTSFQVQRPEDVDPGPASGLAAALGVPSAPPAASPPPARASAEARRTVPAAHKATMLGVASEAQASPGNPHAARRAAPGISRPANPTAAAPAPLTPSADDPFGDDPFGEIDLPAMVDPAKHEAAPAGSADEGIDLPLPRPARSETSPTRSPAEARTAPAVPRAVEARQTPALELEDIDLPSPAGRVAKTGIEFGEIDLPAAIPDKGARRSDSEEFDLPARGSPPAAAPPASSGLDLELPVVRGTPGRGAVAADLQRDSLEADLPGLPSGGVRTARDAPNPRQTALGGFGEIDLPTRARQISETQRGRETQDLPLPTGGIALPSVVGSAGLPAAGGAADLPSGRSRDRGIDLPSPAQGTGRGDLPATRHGDELPELSNLPSATQPGLPERSSRGFGEIELPTFGGTGASPPVVAAGLPAPVAGSAGDNIDGARGQGFGASDLGLNDRFEDTASDAGSLQLETISSAPPPAGPPGDVAPAMSVASTAAVQRRLVTAAADVPPKSKRTGLKIAFGAVALAVAAGGSLALLPDVGPYGVYWITDQLKKDEYAALVQRTVTEVRKTLGQDTFPAAKHALDTLAAARAKAKRVQALPAYAAFVGFMRELRFGSEPDIHARSQALLSELDANKHTQYLEVALAAQAAANGQLARARQLLIGEARRTPKNIDLAVLRGEMELRARDAKAALAAWKNAASLEASARTAFGLARALHAAGKNEDAEKQARLALSRNKDHVGARILLARITWETNERESETLAMLDQVLKRAHNASKDELVRTQTLLGDVHLARSRVSQAEGAYTEALKLDPKAGRALAGLGDALYLAGRNSEALARFEAAIQADPDDLSAKLGAAKTQIALERLNAAASTLAKLRHTYPKSLGVAYWNGKVEEALGKRELAEADYKKAIALGVEQHASDSDLVDAYVGLATLLGQLGRVDEARKTLDEARAKLPDSSSIHKALGEVALAAGRYEQAVDEYKKALELDPKDIGAKFQLGVAYRRNRQFDEALKIFDEVAEVDRDHPGLALERGMLYEESGRSDDALKAYESALAKAPNDPDLMLRVGCVKAAGGGYKEAQKLLSKVLDQRPDSAETHYCQGRALLAEGTNLAAAIKMLETAVQLDPNRPEYHLYLGWAAGEAGHTNQAATELAKAIALDHGMADAYWRRGVLESRQGAFRDAVTDLKKALELRPSRFEAHAALADAYSELGREPDALVEWAQAVHADPNNAVWQFRYGKLLTNNNRNAEGQAHLGKAIDLAEQAPSPPRWLWEAEYMMARAIGSRPEARPHWEAFLRLGPSDSPYREEAKRELKKFGHPWSGQ